MKKKRTFQDFLRGFRGFSVSVFGIGGGVSFAPPTNERETVLKLISQLGDRRVLFHSGCGVPRRDMIASAEKMRSNITAAFEQIPKSRAASFLAPMRQACHDFQTFLEANFRSGGSGGPKEDFYIAIGELRGTIGLCLAQLCSLYQIDLEGDLVRILPRNATTKGLTKR
jgi:hypothetical protein